MNENEVMGSAQSVLGKAQRAAGKALGDGELETAGLANQAKGGARKLTGDVQSTLEGLTERVSARMSKAARETRAIYDRASARAHEVTDRVDPFVHERPYAAIGLALGAGVLVGLILGSRAPKVVYVKSRT